MTENQKEEQVITNNKSHQPNQEKQSELENKKKTDDVSKEIPPATDESKLQTEVPNKHHAEEPERSHKTPVATAEQEEEVEEESTQQDAK